MLGLSRPPLPQLAGTPCSSLRPGLAKQRTGSAAATAMAATAENTFGEKGSDDGADETDGPTVDDALDQSGAASEVTDKARNGDSSCPLPLAADEGGAAGRERQQLAQRAARVVPARGDTPGLTTIRVRYLCVCLGVVTLEALSSALVANISRSLTMEIDVLNDTLEMLAISVCIAVEVLKAQPGVDRHRIAALDLAGGFVSTACLSALAIWSLKAAADQLERAEEHASRLDERISFVGLMLANTVFSLSLLSANMAYFWCVSPLLFPGGPGQMAGLNVLATVLHTVVDMFENTCVLATTVYMWRAAREAGPRNNRALAAELLEIDATGSRVIAGITLVSVLFIAAEAYRSAQEFRADPGDITSDSAVQARTATGGQAGGPMPRLCPSLENRHSTRSVPDGFSPLEQ